MSYPVTQWLVDCFGTHHRQSNICLRWYHWFVFSRGLDHTVTCAVSFDNHSISTAFCEQLIGLFKLKSGEFILTNRNPGNCDVFMVLPGSIDFPEEDRSFCGKDKGISFTLLREKDLGGGGGDYTFTTMCHFAGKGIHSCRFTARTNDGDKRMSW